MLARSEESSILNPLTGTLYQNHNAIEIRLNFLGPFLNYEMYKSPRINSVRYINFDVSHCCHTIDFNVTYRIVAVSANHALFINDGSVRWKTLQPGLEDGARPSTASLPNGHTSRETRNENTASTQEEIKWGQLQDYGAVGEGFVDTRRTVFDTVTPYCCVDTSVQLGATVLTLVGLQQEETHAVGGHVTSKTKKNSWIMYT